MCAMLAWLSPELTRPTYSSINLGLLPAASTRVGLEISVGKVGLPQWVHSSSLSRPADWTCRTTKVLGILTVSLGTTMTARDDYDPLAPQREAAFFYGLFLRGHDVDTLRQDIDVPHPMIEKWMKARDFEASFRDNLRRVCAYRKQVLAIFDGLILNEQNRPRLQ